MYKAAEAKGATRKFSEIRRPVTPDRRARIDAIKAGMEAAERLADIRSIIGVTQVDLANRLGVSQGNVSELERRDDLFLSTLRGYVEALGGSIEITAVFPEQRIPVELGVREDQGIDEAAAARP